MRSFIKSQNYTTLDGLSLPAQNAFFAEAIINHCNERVMNCKLKIAKSSSAISEVAEFVDIIYHHLDWNPYYALCKLISLIWDKSVYLEKCNDNVAWKDAFLGLLSNSKLNDSKRNTIKKVIALMHVAAPEVIDKDFLCQCDISSGNIRTSIKTTLDAQEQETLNKFPINFKVIKGYYSSSVSAEAKKEIQDYLIHYVKLENVDQLLKMAVEPNDESFVQNIIEKIVILETDRDLIPASMKLNAWYWNSLLVHVFINAKKVEEIEQFLAQNMPKLDSDADEKPEKTVSDLIVAPADDILSVIVKQNALDKWGVLIKLCVGKNATTYLSKNPHVNALIELLQTLNDSDLTQWLLPLNEMPEKEKVEFAVLLINQGKFDHAKVKLIIQTLKLTGNENQDLNFFDTKKVSTQLMGISLNIHSADDLALYKTWSPEFRLEFWKYKTLHSQAEFSDEKNSLSYFAYACDDVASLEFLFTQKNIVMYSPVIKADAEPGEAKVTEADTLYERHYPVWYRAILMAIDKEEKLDDACNIEVPEGADVNFVDYRGRCLLGEALLKGRFDIIDQLNASKKLKYNPEKTDAARYKDILEPSSHQKNLVKLMLLMPDVCELSVSAFMQKHLESIAALQNINDLAVEMANNQAITDEDKLLFFKSVFGENLKKNKYLPSIINKIEKTEKTADLIFNLWHMFLDSEMKFFPSNYPVLFSGQLPAFKKMVLSLMSKDFWKDIKLIEVLKNYMKNEKHGSTFWLLRAAFADWLHLVDPENRYNVMSVLNFSYDPTGTLSVYGNGELKAAVYDYFSILYKTSDDDDKFLKEICNVDVFLRNPYFSTNPDILSSLLRLDSNFTMSDKNKGTGVYQQDIAGNNFLHARLMGLIDHTYDYLSEDFLKNMILLLDEHFKKFSDFHHLFFQENKKGERPHDLLMTLLSHQKKNNAFKKLLIVFLDKFEAKQNVNLHAPSAPPEGEVPEEVKSTAPASVAIWRAIVKTTGKTPNTVASNSKKNGVSSPAALLASAYSTSDIRSSGTRRDALKALHFVERFNQTTSEDKIKIANENRRFLAELNAHIPKFDRSELGVTKASLLTRLKEIVQKNESTHPFNLVNQWRSECMQGNQPDPLLTLNTYRYGIFCFAKLFGQGNASYNIVKKYGDFNEVAPVDPKARVVAAAPKRY